MLNYLIESFIERWFFGKSEHAKAEMRADLMTIINFVQNKPEEPKKPEKPPAGFDIFDFFNKNVYKEKK